MESWLLFLKGPVFRFALAIAVLGLLRQVVLAVWGTIEAYRNANDKNLPWKQMTFTALDWFIPIKRLFTTEKTIHGFLTFILHLGLIVVPLLLLDHILLWQAGLGIAWPHIPQALADALTVITMVMAAGLIVARLASKTSRVLSRFPDYFLLVLILVIFMTGFIASKPWNPLSWQASMLIHVAAGNLILLMVPFTKLSHMLVWPVTRLVGELGWKFPSRAGEKVALTLDGKEVRPT